MAWKRKRGGTYASETGGELCTSQQTGDSTIKSLATRRPFLNVNKTRECGKSTKQELSGKKNHQIKNMGGRMWRWGRFRVTQKKNEKALQWKMERQKKKRKAKGTKTQGKITWSPRKAQTRESSKWVKKKGFVFSPGHGKGQSAYKNSTNTNKKQQKILCSRHVTRDAGSPDVLFPAWQHRFFCSAPPLFYSALFSWSPFSLSLFLCLGVFALILFASFFFRQR